MNRRYNQLSSDYAQLETENRRITGNGASSIENGLSQNMLDKLKFEETKLAMIDAYKFNHSFDGSNGEPALKFRRQMILFDTKC